MTETETLKAIKARHQQAPTQWRASHIVDECILEAFPLMPSGQENTRETYATLRSVDMEAIDLLSHAHEDIGFLLNLVARATTTIRQLKSETAPPPQHDKKDKNTSKNYAANAAILIKEPAFKAFLKSVHGLRHASDEETDKKVKEMLAIASKNQLNDNPDKANLWLQLTREFEGWKRHG